MPSGGFLIGLALLLATPGPTNTLLALMAATSRLHAAPALLLAQLGAHLVAVIALRVLVRLLGTGVEGLRPGMQAGLYGQTRRSAALGHSGT